MLALYIIGIIVAIIIFLALVAPKKYNVYRSIEIDRPLSEVFEYLKYVKNQDHWSPWAKRDPKMKQEFSGEDGTVGFISKWESDHKQVGAGEQEITSIESNKQINVTLRFFKPWKSESSGYFDTTDAGAGRTNVVWGFHGTHKVPINVMMMFMNMDKMVGKDFEEGLFDLKKTMESSSNFSQEEE